MDSKDPAEPAFSSSAADIMEKEAASIMIPKPKPASKSKKSRVKVSLAKPI